MNQIARFLAVFCVILVLLFGTHTVAVAGDFEDGVAAFERKDYPTAFAKYKKAAEAGSVYAQFNIGLMYDNGVGVTQDYVQAFRWYKKAAEAGNTSAQNNLAGMFNNGKGVTQDVHQAFHWYTKAAEAGNAKAQNSLGIMYFLGHGVSKDYVQAQKWFYIAVATASDKEEKDPAISNRDRVAGKMTALQIAEAQKLAREWKPKK